MIDREYGVPDFPSFSDGFDNPKYKHIITEKENTDTFNVEDILELGFVRSNPTKLSYQHKDNPKLHLEELFEYDYSVKDRVVRRVVIFEITSPLSLSKVVYNSINPSKEDISKIV